MNFSCDKCQRRYSIADEKVRGKTVKVRCKNCQNVISVQGPPAEMEESTRVVSLADVARAREQELAAAAASAPAPAPASANPWEDEPTRAAPGRSAGAPWFVMVKSKQEGPLDEAGLRALMESGAINPRSFFWQQGMADWKRGADIPEVAVIFEAPAPEPEPQAQAPEMDEEAATVAVMSPRGAAPSRGQQARAPVAEEDGAWDNVPTAVGRSVPARESWDLEPQAAAPAQQRQASRAQPQQSQPAWDMDEPQQDQPAWSEPGQSEEQQDQPGWDGQEQQQDDGQQEQQDQPAWDEPEQPVARASGNKVGVGDDLFSDLDLPDRNEQLDEPEPATASHTEPDPLASVRGAKAGREEKKPVEDTRYFMKKSGVTKRNPAWKVALFIMVPLLLVVGGAFALDSLNVVPKVKVVNAQGQTVEKSLLFSGEGRSELRDRLMGHTKPPPAPVPAPAPAPVPSDKKPPAPKPEPGGTEETKAAPDTGKSAEELKALYGDGSKTDTVPEVRKDTEVAAKDAAGHGGPPAEDISKVVEKSQGAFQACVETELRKNPSFKGGKVLLVATVGTSGTVKNASLDRKELDAAPVGDCIKKSAKRMVFPAFKLEDGSGEVDLEIPLVLSSGSL